ncbi:AfsR/SARP family transcriptional regulator [Streptosporangium roseum]|uniref:AfsR/SARP family transcriptional regulator n=1 Tax=Streptosporangium roseum TaxID=2001 RepID=UPI0033273287
MSTDEGLSTLTSGYRELLCTSWHRPERRVFAEVAAEPWAAAETARLNELRLVATELRAAAGLRIGDPAAVVPEAERLTRDEPGAERFGTESGDSDVPPGR